MLESKQGATTLKSTTNDYDPVRHWLVGVNNKDGAGNAINTFTYTRRAIRKPTGLIEASYIRKSVQLDATPAIHA